MKKVYEKMVKKVSLVLLMVFFVVTSQATVYYVSSTGNDSNSGLTTSLSWKSLAKVNATTFKAGDQILFQRGGVYYGSLTIKNSGASGNPITFSAYGTGADPIITGFTTVTSWTNLGSNIWESTIAVSALSTCNIVTVNDINTPMGRYPNANAANGGYLTFQSHSGLTSITSSSLTGTPNWTGAEAVIRTLRYVLERKVITSQSGGTLNFAATGNTPRDNYGFFIQNDSRTLDYQNEWYYNPTTKKLKIFSISQPTNVKVSTVDRLLTVTGDYITVDGIDFVGANDIAVYNVLSSVDHFVFKNCKILFSGNEAMKFQGSYLTIETNIISDSNYKGVDISGSSNVVFRSNTIQNTAINEGQGFSSTNNSNSLVAQNVTSATIEYNQITNTGYCGIYFYGNSITVKNNFIDTFCTILDDGGGIYTYTGSQAEMTSCKIEGNIVLNGVGAYNGTDNTTNYAEGIYLDNNSKNVEVVGNTIAFCSHYGIFLHDSFYTNTHNNTCYSNSVAQIMLLDDENPSGTTINNDITGNIFIATEGAPHVAEYSSVNGGIINQNGVLNDNYYVKINDQNNIIRYRSSIQTAGTHTLNHWKLSSGRDINSKESPYPIFSAYEIQFYFNETKNMILLSIAEPMIDLKGTKYSGSITLQPFTSLVLMKDANPAKYSIEYKSICEGSSYNGWTLTGKYERTLTAKTGGDSIVTTYLTVNPKYAISENIIINAGEIYNGWSTSGTYTRTLSSKFGCDSVVTTNLTVESLKTGSINTTQTIELKKGYNMISTYVAATDPVVSVVTQPIVESGDLIKIQDEAGNSYENWGSFGGWVNNLGNFQTTEGYKIKVAEDCTLQITGLPVALPLDIPLNAGWNIISFPRTDALDAMTIIQPLINQNKLIKVQDEAGNSIEDWGVYGGWKNGIGNFVPGKAYRVKLSASAVLTIQESYPKSALLPVYAEKTSYFTSDTEGNGVDHMNINLVGLREAGFVAGDELAAFDGDVCVGTLKISDLQLNQGSASLVASAMTGVASKDGFKEGSPLQIYLWKQQSGAESTIALTAIKGSLSYLKSASILVQVKSLITTVSSFSDDVRMDVYPNPTQGRFTVRFSTLPETGSRIDVLDLSGRKVASSEVNGLTEEINLAGQAAGMYLVKSVMGSIEKIQKLVLQ